LAQDESAMNVFVLNTGRCGSNTFWRACTHIANYTSAHESRVDRLGADRLDYPANHIEIDNRLSWFLGRLERRFGGDALYVHLLRDEEAVAKSLAKHYSRGIIRAYRHAVLPGLSLDEDPLRVTADYCDTVNANIAQFLKDKPRVLRFALESADQDFRAFWSAIGAEGDLDAALAEFGRKHNETSRFELEGLRRPQPVRRLVRKVVRAVRELPGMLRDA
jgi:hypothetical protein